MAKRRRAPNLTDAHIAAVDKIIDAWTGELTWQALIDRVEIEWHARYTRQSLAKHERVQRAFSAYVERAPKSSSRRPEIEFLKERIARQDAHIRRLEAENSRLLEQFARWAYNAHKKGLDQTYLSMKLPEIDRATETR